LGIGQHSRRYSRSNLLSWP